MKAPLLSVMLMAFWALPTMAGDRYYRSDGTEIQYYLQQPRASHLLVVFQGSDCNSVKHVASVQTIWQALAPDSALLTIEKYGIDDSLPYAKGQRDNCPAAYLKNDTISQRIQDATQLIQALKTSYDNITLAGGSEGGTIAIGVAAQIDDIHAVVALNSGSSSFQHDVEYSIQQTVPEKNRALVLKNVRQFMQQILESTESFPVEMSQHGYAFWKDALTQDLLAPLHKINAPVVIVQSLEDKSVDPLKTQQEVELIIRQGASNVHLQMLPGLNHGLRDATGTSKLKDTVKDVALKLTHVQRN